MSTQFSENQVLSPVQNQLARQKTLASAIARIREKLDTEELCQSTATELRQLLKVDRVAIFRFCGNSGESNSKFVCEDVHPHFPSVDDKSIQKLIEEKQPKQIFAIRDIDEAEISSCDYEILASVQVRALIHAPLLQNNSLWGLLCIHQCQEPRQWQETEFDCVLQIGSHLEVGLRQAESLAALKKKVQAHQQAEQGLRNRNKKLEELVRERTTALEKAHQRLTRNREKSQKRIAVLAKANQRLVQNQQKLLQSQQKLFQSQQKYQWQATRDSLTELYNRREFERRLEKARTASQTSPQEHVVCLLDLDHFKIVNDTCGHAAGDKLLQQISVLLQSDLRETDILARLGGDEFVILFHQCSFEQALKAAQRLRERIEAFQFIWEGKVFKIGTSIGITPLNEQTSQLASSVMKAADAACYAAKNQGGNRVCVYQETGSQNNSK
ncbi:MAG: hypothetical protein BRC47_13280 [Cyanobacteria bacterium QS_7_48_42]|jgi:diguanylate cyclase (GGDEF)-like protein|nr:MAG: hypothetical protein BRC35_08025 [Cyanobacteria bacterium QH_10_48_56]PSO66526.1 MAG: hypothetical protein BRC38_05520 [Cyanobacteria bacterium QH_6_48_35]PSO85948.1 MAG: hypothetical protein BRC43_12670 [Cyanobacteria bacterium QS_3_48_167]PSO98217.1 MAG: hypothetical protein BRC53_05905 [Cyanobacteria bacterium SW_6_48_11]PSP00207.1 MAG: hypothetical protein BRC47_13280 [Cyanobacteria bacterium QS_7_48_42]PSP10983.1 MAG: hypothetical protein BRC50_13205 [Cyanobacteria bacterium SW_11